MSINTLWAYFGPRLIASATTAMITYGVSTADAEAIGAGLLALVGVIAEFVKTRR